ncbi:MAG: enediyne biosynthesis protein UnbU [Ignavibacteriae bacterium]|nr:enediyne biosynthesis protein UnbU [Ignavibacteriota bacterium]
MKPAETVTALYFYPQGSERFRMFALWYFATLFTLLTIFGQTVLGFEQSWAHPIVGVATACTMQFLLEWLDARGKNRPARFKGGVMQLINFLLPAYIPGQAIAILLYPNERVLPMAFAAVVMIGSKVIFRAPVGNGHTQHFLNPSNFGICVTLFLFPWVGLAPPYHFTENVSGAWHWILPGIVMLSGIVVHSISTARLPVIVAWLVGFAAQAFVRSWLFDIPWQAPLVPMTSVAFLLFSLYMIPDPATIPLNAHRQVAFGLAVAVVYGLLQQLHVVFGLFLSLTIVCALRGIGLYLIAAFKERESVAIQPAV